MDVEAALAATTHVSGSSLFFSSAAADAAQASLATTDADVDVMTDAAAQEADATIHAFGLSLSFSSAVAADANITYRQFWNCYVSHKEGALKALTGLRGTLCFLTENPLKD